MKEQRQRITALAQRRSEVETTASLPDRVDDAAELGVVIDSWQFSQGWRPLPTDDHNLMVAAWLEVFDDAGMRREHYKPAYRAAMQRRAELKIEGKDMMPLAADDLVAEFIKNRRMHQEIDESHLLPANAAAACVKCFGVMPHARVCTHEFPPITDDDPLQSDIQEVRAAANAELAKEIQDGIKNLGFKKAIDRQLRCSDAECPNTGNTADGYREGQPCKLGKCVGLMVLAG
jgi:hypothetical protein